jgi:hypothetical protein
MVYPNGIQFVVFWFVFICYTTFFGVKTKSNILKWKLKTTIVAEKKRKLQICSVHQWGPLEITRISWGALPGAKNNKGIIVIWSHSVFPLNIYEVCPKSKCTDFPIYDLGTRVGNDFGCMYIIVQTASVEFVVNYCCLCTVVFYNLCNVCDAAEVLFTKNLCLQDSQLITPSTKMSWNDFENGSSESERALQAIGCCTTITRQLTQRFQLENF